MLPQKISKIRIFNLAENEFQTTKLPGFWNSVTNSLTFPQLSEVSFKFPDFFRFSRSVATLKLIFKFKVLLSTNFPHLRITMILCVI